MSPWAALRGKLGGVGTGALVATAWQGVRVGSQAAWMIALARSIDARGYGAFAGVAGLATALGALTGLGFGLLMLQDASRDPASFAAGWKRAVLTCLWSGSALWLLFQGAAPWVAPMEGPAWQYALIGIPELVCFPLTIVASYAFQTRERMGWAGAMYALVPASNLAAVALFFAFGHERTLAAYLPWHAASSVAAAVAGNLAVARCLRPGHARLAISPRDVREAAGFSLMRLVDNGLGALDKTLVLRLAGAEAAGIYTAAFRLVAVLALPVTSLAMAALPRLFRVDGHSHQGRPFIQRLVVFSLGGGLIAMAGVFVLALCIPWLLGPSFAAAAGFARWLCLFPLLFGLSTLGCNILIASKMRNYRIAVQLGGLATLAGAMALLVPRHGLAGAAVALLLAHGVIVASIAWIVVRGGRPQAA